MIQDPQLNRLTPEVAEGEIFVASGQSGQILETISVVNKKNYAF
jgi:hypothetical protein